MTKCCYGRCHGNPGCYLAEQRLKTDAKYNESPMRHSPQARARASRAKADRKRSVERMCELESDEKIRLAVNNLSPRAKKVWQRLKEGCWYQLPTPAIEELMAAGLITHGSRVVKVEAAFVPVGTKPLQVEQFPGDLP